MQRVWLLYLLWPAVGLPWLGCGGGDRSHTLLNVSYDPTRQLYRRVNRLFAEDHFARTGGRVTVRMSHGGSGSQARAVLDGLDADVVSLALWSDVDVLRRYGLVAEDWDGRPPPYSSTVVFVVRRGNPKGITDWDDLVRPDMSIVTANPQISGGAKVTLLAAWGHVKRGGGSDDEAFTFLRRLLNNAAGLESGSRAATVKFARLGVGDVHLTWENEARLELAELGGAVEVVFPRSGSLRAEPPVAVVEDNVRRVGTGALARAYVDFLYSDEAQRVIAEEGFRPAGLDVPAGTYPVTDILPGGWAEARDRFFTPGGVFDRVYAAGR